MEDESNHFIPPLQKFQGINYSSSDKKIVLKSTQTAQSLDTEEITIWIIHAELQKLI